MKVCSVAAVVLAVALLVSTSSAALSVARDYDALFLKFKSRYNKRYTNAAAEQKARAAYEENLKWAAELAKANPQARFGDNAHMDVPRAEFKATHHSADFSKHLKNRKPIEYKSQAGGRAIDWRAKGAVTGVKNQLNCGGCWSFSTTGNIEGQWFLAGNTLTSLSEQELLSCDIVPNQNNGCKGGLMDYAFEWLISTKNGTIDTEASYPFVSGDGDVPACNLGGRTAGAQIYSHHDLPQSENQIAAYLYDNGPVSIGVDGTTLQTYTGGILTDCQFVQLDHAILIVGYDDTYSTPYWIVKNSWGTTWGEAGYVRLQKGTNQCGINQAATSSLVQKGSGPLPTPSPPSPPTPAGSSSGSSGLPPPPPPPSPASSSSGAVPPAPFPPTPSGSGSATGSNYTLSLCQDSACSQCQQYSFPQGSCVEEPFNGDSLAAQCISGSSLEVQLFSGSESCSGSGERQQLSTNTCYQNVDGKTYLSFSCA